MPKFAGELLLSLAIIDNTSVVILYPANIFANIHYNYTSTMLQVFRANNNNKNNNNTIFFTPPLKLAKHVNAAEDTY